MRAREFYGSPPPTPPVSTLEPVAGARAIAALLRLTERQVYRLVEAKRAGRDRDPIPINEVPAIGLCGDKETLLRWWARKLGVTAL
jgi:hypothetical protein